MSDKVLIIGAGSMGLKHADVIKASTIIRDLLIRERGHSEIYLTSMGSLIALINVLNLNLNIQLLHVQQFII